MNSTEYESPLAIVSVPTVTVASSKSPSITPLAVKTTAVPILFVKIIVALSSISFAQLMGPKLVTQQDEHDFGDIKQGEKVKRE